MAAKLELANDATGQGYGADRLLRLPEVRARVGLGRSSIYRKVDAGTFPEPKAVGERAVAWLESDIDRWVASRPAKRGGQLAGAQ